MHKVRIALKRNTSPTSTTLGPGYNINMFHYVYVLESISEQTLYIGYTTDLLRRLKEHNEGKNQSTKHSRPWKVIFYEAYRDQSDAERREKYLKTNQGSRLLKRM